MTGKSDTLFGLGQQIFRKYLHSLFRSLLTQLKESYDSVSAKFKRNYFTTVDIHMTNNTANKKKNVI